MSDAVRTPLALARARVLWIREAVARQRALVVRLGLLGLPIGIETATLRLFEDSLSIFEQHAASMGEPRPVPAPSRR